MGILGRHFAKAIRYLKAPQSSLLLASLFLAGMCWTWIGAYADLVLRRQANYRNLGTVANMQKLAIPFRWPLHLNPGWVLPVIAITAVLASAVAGIEVFSNLGKRGNRRRPAILLSLACVAFSSATALIPVHSAVALNRRECRSLTPYARVGAALVEWLKNSSAPELVTSAVLDHANPARSQLFVFSSTVPGEPRMPLRQVPRVLAQYAFLGEANAATLPGTRSEQHLQSRVPLFVTCVLPDPIIGSARYMVYGNKTFRVIRASDWMRLRGTFNRLRKEAGLGAIPRHPWHARQFLKQRTK